MLQATFVLLDDLTFNCVQTVNFDDEQDLGYTLADGRFIAQTEKSGTFFGHTVYVQDNEDPFTDRMQYVWALVVGDSSHFVAKVLHNTQASIFGPENYNVCGNLSECRNLSDVASLTRDLAKFTAR